MEHDEREHDKREHYQAEHQPQPLDFRSDTVTQPTPAMREAIFRAEVGDDVYGDDPTVNLLEATAAQLLGKEAALFLTSGTQSNACAVMSQTRRGQAIIGSRGCHVEAHEAGNYAQLSGVSLRIAAGEKGQIDPEDLARLLTDDSDPHVAEAGLVLLENAHSCGSVVPLDNMRQCYAIAQARRIPVHLDGARLFNAALSLGAEITELTACCDTVSLCLSKGLCAPAGTILAGPEATIRQARRCRKILGGGLRQSGFLAAAGLLALTEMPARLPEDHANARLLAQELAGTAGIELATLNPEINMVFFRTNWQRQQQEGLVPFLWQHNFRISPAADGEFRLVTHYGLNAEHCRRLAALIRAYASEQKEEI